MPHDIEKEHVRCMNTFTLPIRLKGRMPNVERPNTDPIYKLPKVKNASKGEKLNENKIFEFPNQKKKKPKKRINNKKTPMNNVLEVEDMIGNKNKPKLNKNY